MASRPPSASGSPPAGASACAPAADSASGQPASMRWPRGLRALRHRDYRLLFGAQSLHTPDELRGRVMSLYTLISGGTFPFGSLAVGAISERWGIPAALLAAGGVGLLGIAALAARETRGRLR